MLHYIFRAILIITLLLCFIFLLYPGFGRRGLTQEKGDIDNNLGNDIMGEKVKRTNEEWKELLSEQEYLVLRKKGTERAFTGKYNNFEEEGIFKCAGCGNELFNSDTKYDSGSGWPSFWSPLSKNKVELREDNSLFMTRTEVVCARCGGHLGHVFDDGPAPTHQRYCINSVSLDFEKTKKDSSEN